MKILKNNISTVIQNPAMYIGICLYGSDIGVLNAREMEIKKSLQSKEFILVDLNEGREMLDVFNECFTPSLFNSSKLIFIVGSESAFIGIEDIIEKIPEGFPNFIVICVRDNLDTKSKLRKLCESHQKIATIACYPDEEVDIINIINNFIKENKIQITKDAVTLISQKFKGNRGVLMLELEKLKLYKPEGNITLEDVVKIMDDAKEGNIFEAINLLFSFKLKEFLKEVDVLEIEGIPASVLALNIINYLLKLISIMEERESEKKTFDQILEERRVFFKQIPIMKDHLSRFNLNGMHELLQKLILLEIDVRRHSGLKYLQIKNFAVKFFV